MAETTSLETTGSTAKQAYIVVGVVAAAVSAATAGYIFWQRHRMSHPEMESVQKLLDRCHDQVRSIEERLGELGPPPQTLAGAQTA